MQNSILLNQTNVQQEELNSEIQRRRILRCKRPNPNMTDEKKGELEIPVQGIKQFQPVAKGGNLSGKENSLPGFNEQSQSRSTNPGQDTPSYGKSQVSSLSIKLQ